MSIIRANQLDAWEKRVDSGVHFMLGNYALVEGAISAGCNFFAGYPITPANEISERMSQRLPQVGGQFVQGEDELCSIFALAGASLAGGKVMTATASAARTPPSAIFPAGVFFSFMVFPFRTFRTKMALTLFSI